MPQTILIVEDNEDLLSILAMQLRRGGYTVVEAQETLTALTQLKEQRPDLVLLDLMMPDRSGYAVLERIQGEPELQRIPVIVLSAITDLEIIDQCMELGARDYVPKPYTSDDLLNRISSVLGDARSSGPATPA